MKLLKADWVSHDGKPIFSIDIHPDGSRFATGGQGDNSGKVVVWNMAPVRNEKDEADENVPKMLCTMENHLACVNCVRWSNSGKFLASGGDDKLIMIWQTSRYAGVSTVFGSEGKLVNVEQWRCVSTLRGHSGDILDLAWSPNDAWLASCSVDNTVVIWNANKFPEQVTVLRGHTSLVKGVTWDPVGKYVASQSDDKSVRVWRTLDWKQEVSVTEPFQECGGTTHVLRLGWSPDGHYIVSAHAMNNSGPTAQIIERNGFKTEMDFVGHRKAITVVRFNPNIFSKKKKKKNKTTTYSCCAIGSRDRSLSVWITCLKRPLVVCHDIFSSSILDISWSADGMELLCCSWDGTIAYFGFEIDEIGGPLGKAEKEEYLRHNYGISMANNKNTQPNQIIETAAMLNIQQEKEKTSIVNNTSSNSAFNKTMVNGQTPVKSAITNGSTKQIETKTPDGRRRIRPILLAPQPEIGDLPLPFSSNSSQPVFSSSTEKSKINIEQSLSPPDANKSSVPQLVSPNAPSSTGVVASSNKPTPIDATTPSTGDKMNSTKMVPDTSPIQAISGSEGQGGDKSLITTPTSSMDRVGDKTKLKLGPKRKLDTTPGTPTSDVALPKKKDGRGRPRKDRALENAAAMAAAAAAAAARVPATVVEKESRIVYSSSGLSLPTSTINKNVCIQVSGAVGSSDALVLDVENDVVSGPNKLHRIRGIQNGTMIWESVLSSKAIAVAGNSHIAVVACEDQSVNVLSSVGGQRLFPCMVLDSKVSSLRCSGVYFMVITSKGSLFVWNFHTRSAVIKNESLVSVIPNSDVKLVNSLLTEQGLPVVTISTGKTFTYKADLGCWVLLNHNADTLHLCSDHKSCIPTGESLRKGGPLATLQAAKHRGGAQASTLYRVSHPLQQASTLSHLENQMSSCLALQSTQEYHFWFLTYIRYLVQEGVETRLREVCNDLLGPVYKTKSANKWESHILKYSKRSLLAEILPTIGSNLRLQRLFTEYQEQLETVNS